MVNKDINVYYQNIRGINSKIETFNLNVLNNNYDIIALTETWLNSNVNSSELFDNRYTVFRSDRDFNITKKKRGGGVILAIKNEFIPERVTELEGKNNSVWVKARINPNTWMFFNVVYFEPCSNLNDYKNYCDLVYQFYDAANYNVCIMGDFNIPNITCSNFNFCVGSPSAREIGKLISFLNASSLNNILNKNNKTLDLIFSNCNQCLVIRDESPLIAEDTHHPSLNIDIKNIKNINVNKPHYTLQSYNFKRGNFRLLYELFRNIDWNVLLNYTDVNNAIDHFYSIIFMCSDRAFPKGKFNRRKSTYPIWFSAEIIKDIKLKAYHRKKMSACPESAIEFKRLRKAIKSKIKKAYSKYLADIENNIRTNPKAVFDYIKRKHSSNDKCNTFKINNKFVQNSNVISAKFAEYFSSVYEKSSLKVHDISSYSSSTNSQTPDLLVINKISINDIEEAFKSLKFKKSAGPDEIPGYIVNGCKDLLLYPLLIIFNLSLSPLALFQINGN